MALISLFQCDPWCLPTQNWLQVATNGISIQEFHNVMPHYNSHYFILFLQVFNRVFFSFPPSSSFGVIWTMDSTVVIR